MIRFFSIFIWVLDWPTSGAEAKFVVSTGLNPAATKAFYDALRLSRPGPVIWWKFGVAKIEGQK